MKNENKFRIYFFVLIIIINCISPWFLGALNRYIFWVACLFIPPLIFSTIMTFLTGKSLWWYLSFFLLTFLIGAAFQMPFLKLFFEIRPTNVVLTLLLSLPIASYLAFNWGYHLCDDDVFEEAIKLKKINTITGTFVPFAFIRVLIVLKSKKIERLLIQLMLFGSLFILVSSITLLSHWTGKYISEAQIIGGVMVYYLCSLVYIVILSISVREFFWIKIWETKKRQKMRFAYAANAFF